MSLTQIPVVVVNHIIHDLLNKINILLLMVETNTKSDDLVKQIIYLGNFMKLYRELVNNKLDSAMLLLVSQNIIFKTKVDRSELLIAALFIYHEDLKIEIDNNCVKIFSKYHASLLENPLGKYVQNLLAEMNFSIRTTQLADLLLIQIKKKSETV